MKYPTSGFLICFLFSIGFLLVGNQVQAAPKAGDILVVDQIGPQEVGALFLVKRKTGRRILLSDFGNPAQGPLGLAPASVAVGPSGQIYVSDLFAGEPFGGALFEIDPDTGNRTLVSNFGPGPDPQVALNYGLAVDTDGTIVANASRLVVRIQPDSDERAPITDLADPVQGETEPDRFIFGLALERSRHILIGTGGFDQVDSAIFRVNPVSGRRTLLSDFANPAQGTDVADLVFSNGLAVERSGQILAVSNFQDLLLLLRVHPRTGQRTVVSNFSDPALGPTVDGFLFDVAVKRSGKIIVASGDTVFKVHPRSGRRTVFSDSGDTGQGPPFQAITSIAVVPTKVAGLIEDSDRDGVADADDFCPATQLPEAVPTRGRLLPNRFAITGAGPAFSTDARGAGKKVSFTIFDTQGCSCEQIIDYLGLGQGHRKHGCSLGVMRTFIEGLPE